ncbi:TPA: hypothetical protein MFN23_005399 [Klebsiella pneumoniae]|nr:hypothetical protein [Klebsiella pneumoniae]HBW8576537.1 hypothetical protein [Klebsiella pneumoniae]HBW8684160.1 hypothetical protein [Klebsiella pneumoniae]HBZ1077103.1 hypothetical protein [Klebsiella pneumoniae]HBZ1406030.1 hypothetical protein [Klebsiella pneumoniae]
MDSVHHIWCPLSSQEYQDLPDGAETTLTYKGLLKNDNQLAMLFTLANLFRVDQMIRQWERSQ